MLQIVPFAKMWMYNIIHEWPYIEINNWIDWTYEVWRNDWCKGRWKANGEGTDQQRPGSMIFKRMDQAGHCRCIATGDRLGKMAKTHQSHSSASEREREGGRERGRERERASVIVWFLGTLRFLPFCQILYFTPSLTPWNHCRMAALQSYNSNYCFHYLSSLFSSKIHVVAAWSINFRQTFRYLSFWLGNLWLSSPIMQLFVSLCER